MLLCAVAVFVLQSVFNQPILEKWPYSLSAVVLVIGASLSIVGMGLFEANAIQFGLDQLLEAPTHKHIHWYYWSKNVADLVFFYLVLGIFGFHLAGDGFIIETNKVKGKHNCAFYNTSNWACYETRCY